MKKALVTVLILALLVVFTGCGGPKPEQPVSSGSSASGHVEPAPTTVKPTEPNPAVNPAGNDEIVSITDFMNLMMSDLGKWECPAQYNDYFLEFSYSTGRPLVDMSKRNMDDDKTTHLLAEIGSVTYNKEQSLYTAKLLDYDVPLAYKELHVEVSAIGEGFIHAENIYDDNRTVEYIFSADSNEIIGVESDVWVMKDEDLIDDYKPTLSLDSAGYFSFRENLYSGMGHIWGVYEESDTQIACTVYSIDYAGYAGDNVYYIVFEKTSPTTLTLQTEICYSHVGSVFELQ